MIKIANVTIVVKDYDEAIEFYTEKLNFTLIADQKLSDEMRWVLISPGENSSSLLLEKAKTDEQKSRIGNQTGGSVFMILYTDDFNRDYNNFQKNNVKMIRDRSEEIYGTVCVFADLYGNLWDLIQPKGL